MNDLAGRITDSELEVMQVLWDADEQLSVTEIRRRVQQRSNWESTTVKTLIQRLTAKGVLAQEKRDVFYYSPLVSREDYNGYATGNFLSKVYRGSARNLVATLLRYNDQGLIHLWWKGREHKA